MLLDSERLGNLEVAIDDMRQVEEVKAEVFLVLSAPLLLVIVDVISLFNVVDSRVGE